MKLTVWSAIAIFFVSTSLLSLAFILFESSNYDSYFWQGRSAILDPTSNNTRVNTVIVTKDFATGKIIVKISVSATNPTNYSGFMLQGFDLTFFFLRVGSVNESIFQNPKQQLLANIAVDRSLDPKSTVTTDILLSLNSTQSISYQMFNQTYNGNLDAHVVLVTVVNSFLDPVYGVMTTTKEQEIPVK